VVEHSLQRERLEEGAVSDYVKALLKPSRDMFPVGELDQTKAVPSQVGPGAGCLDSIVEVEHGDFSAAVTEPTPEYRRPSFAGGDRTDDHHEMRHEVRVPHDRIRASAWIGVSQIRAGNTAGS
jgi:hypothetical protein